MFLAMVCLSVIKQLLDLVFGYIRNNQGLGKRYQPWPSAWLNCKLLANETTGSEYNV